MTLKVHIKKLSKKDKVCFEEKFKRVNIEMSKCIVYAAMYDNKYIGGLILNKKPPFYLKNSIKEVNILFLYLLPKFRGFGYAKKLLEIVVKKYSFITFITNNRLSSKVYYLYKTSGFNVIGKIDNLKYWSYKRTEIATNTDFTWFCKPHSCKMLKEACLKRQLLAKLPVSFQQSPIYFESGCNSCKDAAPFT